MGKFWVLVGVALASIFTLALTLRAETDDGDGVGPPPPVPSAQAPVPSPPRPTGWIAPPPVPYVPPAYYSLEPPPVAPVAGEVKHAGCLGRAVGNLGAWLERARWDTVRVPPAPAPAALTATVLYQYQPPPAFPAAYRAMPMTTATPQSAQPWSIMPPPPKGGR